MDTKQMLEEIYDKIGTKRINEGLETVTDIGYGEHTYSVNKGEYQEGYYPISLSRVLSALGKEYRVQRSEERIDYALKMGLVRKDAVGSTDGDTINISWELLNQDNSDAMLDNQSHETIKAIYDILLPTK